MMKPYTVNMQEQINDNLNYRTHIKNKQKYKKKINNNNKKKQNNNNKKKQQQQKTV